MRLYKFPLELLQPARQTLMGRQEPGASNFPGITEDAPLPEISVRPDARSND